MTEEQHIQKGFNAGYQLQQHKPELATELQQGFTDKDHPYAQGFSAGREQYTKDASKDQSKGMDKYFNKIKNRSQGLSKDNSKDKGMDL
jgi:hypothetical protein